MKKASLRQLYALVRGCGAEAILRAAALCDGHCILDPQALIQAGLPPEVVAHVTVAYKSDFRDPKSTLYVAGVPVEQLTGVYGLNLLMFLAAALHVPYRPCMGRGFQAQAIRDALQQHFDRMTNSTSGKPLTP